MEKEQRKKEKKERKKERKRARRIWWRNSDLKMILDTISFIKKF